jgi:hypothetical protein
MVMLQVSSQCMVSILEGSKKGPSLWLLLHVNASLGTFADDTGHAFSLACAYERRCG